MKQTKRHCNSRKIDALTNDAHILDAQLVTIVAGKEADK